MSTNHDHTAARLRAFLASMRPLPDCDGIEDDDSYQRGRSTIERLALSASGDDAPTAHLIGSDVANVLAYLSSSMPIEPRNWWNDPEDGLSHVVGFKMLLEALEASLREGSTPPASVAPADHVTHPADQAEIALDCAYAILDLLQETDRDSLCKHSAENALYCAMREIRSAQKLLQDLPRTKP